MHGNDVWKPFYQNFVIVATDMMFSNRTKGIKMMEDYPSPSWERIRELD